MRSKRVSKKPQRYGFTDDTDRLHALSKRGKGVSVSKKTKKKPAATGRSARKILKKSVKQKMDQHAVEDVEMEASERMASRCSSCVRLEKRVKDLERQLAELRQETNTGEGGTSGSKKKALSKGFDISPDLREKHDFRLSLAKPLPIAISAGTPLPLEVDAVSQNKFPNAISQMMLYFQNAEGKIDVVKIYDRVPGSKPKVFHSSTVYQVPENCPPGKLEVGWAGELQYTFEDAKNNFLQGRSVRNLLGTIGVTGQGSKKALSKGVNICQDLREKHDFRLSFTEPLPIAISAGTPLSLEVDAVSQNKFPNAISQMMLYFQDAVGNIDAVKIYHRVPGSTPKVFHSSTVYQVPADCPPGKLEVGWSSDLQYTFEDAENNLLQGRATRNLLGTICVTGQEGEPGQSSVVFQASESVHASSVKIIGGGNRAICRDCHLHLHVSVLPQNINPNIPTRIFLYVGTRNARKTLYLLFDGCPGTNPKETSKVIDYVIKSEDVKAGEFENDVVEIGWAEDRSSSSWEEAKRRFPGNQKALIKTVTVSPYPEERHPPLLSLAEPLPTWVPAGAPLSVEVDAVPQTNNYKVKTQMMLYFKNAEGNFDAVKIFSGTPGWIREVFRSSTVYQVPEDCPLGKLEVGWLSAMKPTFEDAKKLLCEGKGARGLLWTLMVTKKGVEQSPFFETCPIEKINDNLHDTSVKIIGGDNRAVPADSQLHLRVSVLPQNNKPSTTTRIFLYIGTRNSRKTFHLLFNGCPGINPQEIHKVINYIIKSEDVQAGEFENDVVEIGWAEDRSSSSWEEAKRNFPDNKKGLIKTVAISPAYDVEHDFRLSLAEPLPTSIPAGAPISMEVDALSLSNHPEMIGLMMLYFQNVEGDVDLSIGYDTSPGSVPDVFRKSAVYRVPENCPLGKLKVIWIHTFERTIEDYKIEILRCKAKRHLLGTIEVTKKEVALRPFLETCPVLETVHLHDSSVKIIKGGKRAVLPGGHLHLRVSVLPQNNAPDATTRIFLYVNIRNKTKTFYSLFEGCPGMDSQETSKAIDYIVKAEDVESSDLENDVIEIGWAEDRSSSSWEEAKSNFPGNMKALIKTVPISPRHDEKHGHRLNLAEPLPTSVPAGAPLSMEVDAVPQNHFPGAISQIMLYFQDAEEKTNVVEICNTVPGSEPDVFHRSTVYQVPENCPLGRLEVGWADDLQYTFEDAKNNLLRGIAKRHVLGTIEVTPKEMETVNLHESSVKIIDGGNRAVLPGSHLHLQVSVLPQNNAPNATTRIFLYVGTRNKTKTFYSLFEGCPGTNPQETSKVIDYIVRAEDVKPGQFENDVVEIGWAEDTSSSSWEEATENFPGNKKALIKTVVISPQPDTKHRPRLNLAEPLPTEVPAGASVSIEVDAVPQNNFPTAITQMMLYFQNAEGSTDVVKLYNAVPRSQPKLFHSSTVYQVPENCPLGKLEVGWAQTLQYTFEDGKNNLLQGKPKRHLLGTIEVTPKATAESSVSEPLPVGFPEQQSYMPVPFFASIFGGPMATGKGITIQGRVPHGADRFDINVQCGSRPYPLGDIAFHFNPRFGDCNTVVRNTLIQQKWGREERSQPYFPFAHNQNFEIIIVCESKQYRVTVNGKHFIDYRYRIERLNQIDTLAVGGGVQMQSIRFHGDRELSHYHCTESLTNPVVPFSVAIPNKVKFGWMLVLIGKVKPNPEGFLLNLQSGAAPNPDPHIRPTLPMHFNCPFDTKVIACNSRENNQWGQEERRAFCFPFVPGRPFEMRISCTPKRYEMDVNGEHVLKFNHRLPVELVDTVFISGDVDIYQMRFQ